MSIIQTFYDNLAAQYDKLFLDWLYYLTFVFMYRTLTYPKRLCCLAHSCIVVDNVVGDADCTLFNIIFQRKSPQNSFVHSMCRIHGV